MAALTSGDLDFEENVGALSAVLEKGGSKKMLSKLMGLAKSDEIGLEGRRGVLTGIAGIGGEGELRAIFEPGRRIRWPAPSPSFRVSFRANSAPEEPLPASSGVTPALSMLAAVAAPIAPVVRLPSQDAAVQPAVDGAADAGPLIWG